MSTVFAKAGQFVTDSRGVIVCTVAHDLTLHGRVSVDSFTDWRVAKPVKGAPLDKTPGFRGATDKHGPQVCIEGRWLPRVRVRP